MAHELVLMRVELKEVHTANEVLSKRRRPKKVRLRTGSSLSMQEAEDRLQLRQLPLLETDSRQSQRVWRY
jgi:hypothetical protein